MGFREIPHTADVALQIWAPDLQGLFREAGRGFNSVSGARLGSSPRLTRNIDLAAVDVEGLLVAFLTELVYAQEHDQLGFDDFRLQIADTRLTGQLTGAPLLSLVKPIKAVTYHNLAISHTGRGHEVEVVFDV